MVQKLWGEDTTEDIARAAGFAIDVTAGEEDGSQKVAVVCV